MEHFWGKDFKHVLSLSRHLTILKTKFKINEMKFKLTGTLTLWEKNQI